MSGHLTDPKLDDEAGRQAALERYELLDTQAEREFDDIVGLVKQIFDMPMAAVSLIDTDRQWFKASCGLDLAQTDRRVAFCDHTIRDTQPLAVPDTTQDPRFADNPLVAGPPHLRSYLGVPLTSPDGYNVGSLCVIGTETRDFGAADMDLLTHFARLVVSQMELRMLARRDALTGALTRRAFDEALREAVCRRAGEPLPMSLLIFDIDRFKEINDRFGHPVGDRVISAVASTTRAVLRKLDRFGRLGGEEFGVLLVGADLTGAAVFAERVRRTVSGLALPELEGRQVSVSAGVAALTPGVASADDWIRAADDALYAAKRGGRNRVANAA